MNCLGLDMNSQKPCRDDTTAHFFGISAEPFQLNLATLRLKRVLSLR